MRAETLAEIGAAVGEREDGHDLGGGGDHEPGLARGPVLAAAEPGGDAAQRAIVHVHAARPQDLLRIDPQLVAEVQMRVEQRGQQVVRRGDGVEVAGEVQVDLVERRERRLAAAGRAALLAEDGAERRLAQRGDGVVPALDQPLRQADGGDGLAFAARRRRDGGDEDQLAAALAETDRAARDESWRWRGRTVRADPR